MWGQVAGVVVGSGRSGWVQAKGRQGGHAEVLGGVVRPEAPQVVLGDRAGGHHVVHGPLEAAGENTWMSEGCGEQGSCARLGNRPVSPHTRSRRRQNKGSPGTGPGLCKQDVGSGCSSGLPSMAWRNPWLQGPRKGVRVGSESQPPSHRGNGQQAQTGLQARGSATIWQLSGSAGTDPPPGTAARASGIQTPSAHAPPQSPGLQSADLLEWWEA